MKYLILIATFLFSNVSFAAQTREFKGECVTFRIDDQEYQCNDTMALVKINSENEVFIGKLLNKNNDATNFNIVYNPKTRKTTSYQISYDVTMASTAKDFSVVDKAQGSCLLTPFRSMNKVITNCILKRRDNSKIEFVFLGPYEN